MIHNRISVISLIRTNSLIGTVSILIDTRLFGLARVYRIVLCRSELISFGILEDTDFFTETGQEDEILAELKRKQKELQVTTQLMRKQRKELIFDAQKEILNQEGKVQLEQLNNEICEAWKKLNSTRQKKKPLSKKERDQIASLVEQRQELVRRISS